jgi:acetyltransferase-like isoleucine patch superfamily enzyme
MKRDREFSVIKDVDVGEGCTVYDQVNLYGCEVGDDTKIDAFVYIEEDVSIGSNCTVRPFVFIPTGVEIRDNVFIGPHVSFTNDMYPRATGDWELKETVVHENVGIGAGVTVLPGVDIGANSLVGAGSVVTDDVPEDVVVAGNPAHPIDTV